MNSEHYDRLTILKEIEGTFPGLPTEQVLSLARWVEGDASAADEEAKEFHRKVEEDGDRMRMGLDPIHFKIPDAPRKWTNLDAIPSNVKRIKDKNGAHAKRIAFGKELIWVYIDNENPQAALLNTHGPFTEVLEDE